jgi:hypothetical protein
MTTTIILVLAAVLVLAVLLLHTRKRALTARWLQNPTAHLRSVDLAAFRNLIDPSEEQFLRAHLPPSEFRRVQKERLRAAAEYVSAVAHNAAVLLRLGQAARLSADSSTVAAAENLVDTALRLRLIAMRSLVVLRLKIILRGSHVSLAAVAERYEHITGQVALLVHHAPLRRVSAAL